MNNSTIPTFSADNPAVQQYVFYSSILILKLIIMSLLTALRRITSGSFISTEDAKFFSRGQEDQPKVDLAVERVRRAHLNDLENIPAFIIIAGMYVLTDPAVAAIGAMMKVFLVARVVHTLVYAFREVPQPFRAISWVIGYGITIYMACSVFYHFI